jgi:hypothetical protein
MPSGFSMPRSKNWELKFCLHVEKTKIMLGAKGKLLIERLRPTNYKFFFTNPELAFHDFSLAPHHYIYISAK